MAIATEGKASVPRLLTKREPKATPDAQTMGIQAFDDGIKIIGAAILLMAVMYFSLSAHIV